MAQEEWWLCNDGHLLLHRNSFSKCCLANYHFQNTVKTLSTSQLLFRDSREWKTWFACLLVKSNSHFYYIWIFHLVIFILRLGFWRCFLCFKNSCHFFIEVTHFKDFTIQTEFLYIRDQFINFCAALWQRKCRNQLCLQHMLRVQRMKWKFWLYSAQWHYIASLSILTRHCWATSRKRMFWFPALHMQFVAWKCRQNQSEIQVCNVQVSSSFNNLQPDEPANKHLRVTPGASTPQGKHEPKVGKRFFF